MPRNEFLIQIGLMSLHESAFGGKLEGRILPSLESLRYLIVFRAVHSPFQSLSLVRLPSSCMSGAQKPDSYS